MHMVLQSIELVGHISLTEFSWSKEDLAIRHFGTKGRELYICYRAGLVYVSERGNHRVSVFTDEGTFFTPFGGVKGNRSRREQLNRPRGIAVDRSGVVYVCDTENNRLTLL